MILKQGHEYRAMPHDGKLIAYIYRGGRCYYKDSPYSLAATQALKAAFPQYWTAIRNYGVAHPQLVPFINEDPMLIVSLVEVGKTRWLVGDGGGYINTGYIRNTNSKLICDMSSLDGRDVAFLGTRGSAFLFYNFSGNYFYPISRCDNIQGILVIGNKYHMEWDSTDFILTGDDGVYQSAKRNIANQDLPMYIFNFNPTDYRYAYARLANFVIEEGGTKVMEMYPFIRNGENGMLDILSGTFHPNANTKGAFTIQVTDKA